VTIALIGPLDWTIFDDAEIALTAAGYEIERFPDEEQFIAHSGDLQAVDVIGASPAVRIDRDLIQRMPRLKGIVSAYSGLDGFDLRAASDRGLAIANGQIPENRVGVAEAAIMLMLVLRHDLRASEAALRQTTLAASPLNAHLIWRTTIGLIGFGQLAQEIARRVSTWDVQLLASLRTPRPVPDYITVVPLEDLLIKCNVVIVAAGLSQTTRHMLAEEQLRLMREDVIFINVARGGLVDELALVRLAKDRPEMRLALDVFETEPLPAENALRDLPNAILTPHCVGHTVESQEQLSVAFIENLLAVARGTVPPFVVSPTRANA
jgi:phosphoglycerate dehydrogenase-like enzyme